MSKYDDAIEKLSERYMVVSMCLDKEDCINNNKAIDLAIEALHQAKERECGCEYCNNGERLTEIDEENYTFIHNNELRHTNENVGYFNKEINYCPNCGSHMVKE